MRGKFWLVTWTTHGSWLPGDPRGFQTWRGREHVPPPKRYARPGEPTYEAEPYEARHAHAKSISGQGVRFYRTESRVSLNAMVEEINGIEVQPRIISVAPTHVHFIARFGRLEIRPTVKRIKSAATRAMPRFGDGKFPWVRGCHMESLPDDDALRKAVDYVSKHVLEDAVIYVWPA